MSNYYYEQQNKMNWLQEVLSVKENQFGAFPLSVFSQLVDG